MSVSAFTVGGKTRAHGEPRCWCSTTAVSWESKWNRKRKKTEIGRLCNNNDIVILYGRERDCGEPVRVGYCVLERRCRHNRRPASFGSPLPPPEPLTHPAQAFGLHMIIITIMLLSRVEFATPLPWPPPHRHLRKCWLQLEQVKVWSLRLKKHYKDQNHSCVVGSYRIRLTMQPRCVCIQCALATL